MRDIKETVWLGVWLLIVPFLGIPSAWKERLIVLTGAALVGASVLSFRREKAASSPQKEVATDAYRESSEKPSRSKDAV